LPNLHNCLYFLNMPPYLTRIEGPPPKRNVVRSSRAGGAKHRDFTVNHGVFITICPIIKLSEYFHLAAAALMGSQMDSNTF